MRLRAEGEARKELRFEGGRVIDVLQRELAAKYGVNTRTISKVINRRLWPHIA